MIYNFLCFCSLLSLIHSKESNEVFLDILQPYIVWPTISRTRRSLLNNDFETHSTDENNGIKDLKVQYFAQDFKSAWISGHHAIFPSSLLSISQAGGKVNACSAKKLETVEYSSNISKCRYATNAGFFNISDGSCLGYLVINGSVIHNSANINVHFGILKNNDTIFIGYLNENIKLEDFKHLVGGVIWLVRKSANYIEESLKKESPETQTTGTLVAFASLKSARTAVGFDNNGNIHLIQVDGKTNLAGISLFDMADLLISMGITNAINLDGGGSTTTVFNGNVINYPSDKKLVDGFAYSQPRAVSSIMCVSYQGCSSADCWPHGTCIEGNCHCSEGWIGKNCDTPSCPIKNCLEGICTLENCYNEFVLTEKSNTIVPQYEKWLWMSALGILFITSIISILINCCRFDCSNFKPANQKKRFKITQPLISSQSSDDETEFTRQNT